MTILYAIISGIMFKIRGGLRVFGKKLPLCKYWFATWFAALACIINGWNWQYFAIMLIASRMATCICGWGEAVGCALGVGKPDPNRQDYLDFDEFCDNFVIDWTFELKERNLKIWKWTIHIPHKIWHIYYKLVDHPQLFGVVWLTLRGFLLSFLIGLGANSVLYILWGAPMGLIYWLSGLFARKVKDDGKHGWHIAEILFGFWLGLGCVLWG